MNKVETISNPNQRVERQKYVHWTFEGEKFTLDKEAGWLGFVYRITSPEGMYYIGKKMFVATTRKKPLKGKLRKRKQVKESDWNKYWGSSKSVVEDRLRLVVEDGWKREILMLCKTKWEMSYCELREQMMNNVLVDPKSYNGIIHIRLGRPNEATAIRCDLIPAKPDSVLPTRIRHSIFSI